MGGRQETALGSGPSLHFVSLPEKLGKQKKETSQVNSTGKELAIFRERKGGGTEHTHTHAHARRGTENKTER